MLLKLLFQCKIHWADRWTYRFPSWKVEGDDPPWEVKPAEVEEGEEDRMVEEVVAAEDWRVVEEVAYSWSCPWTSDWRNFDPVDY